MVKGWGGFVGGSMLKSQWGQKFTYQKQKYLFEFVLWENNKVS